MENKNTEAYNNLLATLLGIPISKQRILHKISIAPSSSSLSDAAPQGSSETPSGSFKGTKYGSGGLPPGGIYTSSKEPPEDALIMETDKGASYWIPGRKKGPSALSSKHEGGRIKDSSGHWSSDLKRDLADVKQLRSALLDHPNIITEKNSWRFDRDKIREDAEAHNIPSEQVPVINEVLEALFRNTNPRGKIPHEVFKNSWRSRDLDADLDSYTSYKEKEKVIDHLKQNYGIDMTSSDVDLEVAKMHADELKVRDAKTVKRLNTSLDSYERYNYGLEKVSPNEWDLFARAGKPTDNMKGALSLGPKMTKERKAAREEYIKNREAAGKKVTELGIREHLGDSREDIAYYYAMTGRYGEQSTPYSDDMPLHLDEGRKLYLEDAIIEGRDVGVSQRNEHNITASNYFNLRRQGKQGNVLSRLKDRLSGSVGRSSRTAASAFRGAPSSQPLEGPLSENPPEREPITKQFTYIPSISKQLNTLWSLNDGVSDFDQLISTLTGIPIKKIALPITVSKTDALNDWLKNDPLKQTNHLVKDSCMCENCFQEKSNYMGIIQQKAVRNVFAIATAQAQEEGHTDFSDDSEGAKKRDEIAEAIKRT